MDKVIMPFLFLAVAAGLFFSYIRPTYDVLLALQAQETRLDTTIETANNLQARVDAMTQQYRLIDEEQLDKLAQLLPASVDAAHMVILIDTLARRNHVIIDSFALPTSARAQNQDASVQWAAFGIEGSGDYYAVKDLLTAMEHSLTLMEVKKVTIGTPPKRGEGQAVTSDLRYNIEYETPYYLAVPTSSPTP